MPSVQVSSPATDVFKDALNNRGDDHMDRWTWMMARMRSRADDVLAAISRHTCCR